MVKDFSKSRQAPRRREGARSAVLVRFTVSALLAHAHACNIVSLPFCGKQDHKRLGRDGHRGRLGFRQSHRAFHAKALCGLCLEIWLRKAREARDGWEEEGGRSEERVGGGKRESVPGPAHAICCIEVISPG